MGEAVSENKYFTELREQLSEIEHDQWIAWSKNIAETEAITPARLARWGALWRPYSELTEAEKDQDREWADKSLAKIAPLLNPHMGSDFEKYTSEFTEEVVAENTRLNFKVKTLGEQLTDSRAELLAREALGETK
jgi:hypothetical protein